MMVFLQGDSGASITLKLKKKDAVPLVSATFSAEPSSIILGETSTLTWSTTNADNVNIEPAIGRVSLSGTHNVEPAETTTYILTASGLGGTITETATVTVTVPNNPPVANQDTATTVTDTPVDINVLANDTDADGDALIISAFTQPENGVVADTGGGIFNYIPNPGFHGTDSFTYAVIDGNGGTDSSTVSVTVLSPITLDITSPSDGATLYMPYVNVQGIITSTSGAETGVAVNGVIAVVFDNQFTTNHIPLQEGQNTITVTATDINGISVTETLTVYEAVSENFIKLSAYQESGIEPLEVALRVNGSFSITNPVITPTGPGTVEQLESENSDKYKYRINTEGLFTFTAAAIGPDGNTYEDTINITVFPIAQIDTLLKAKWDGMTSALESADIESALGFILPSKRDYYKRTFNLLKDQWPSIIATYSDFTIITRV